MYDRQTESLWSQVRREVVAGPMTGAKLKILPSSLTSWEKWRKKHPDTLVLSLDTGYDRDYSRDPYENYYQSRRSFFGFFRGLFDGHAGKELVVGVTLAGAARAYPVETLRERKTVTDTLSGRKLTLSLDPATDQLTVRDDAGEEIPFIILYWFAWKGMYPETGRFAPRP